MIFALKPENFPEEKRVDLLVDQFLWPKRLTRERIKSEPNLKGLVILRMAQQTNYILTNTEGEFISDLVARLVR